MPLVLVSVEDKVGFVTLNHDEKRNALSAPLVAEIIGALADFGRRDVRAVVLRSRPGAKVWSAGHDVEELPETRRDPLGWDDPLRHLIREIETFPAPVIAMIEGTVWGGACETAFACDLIVASPEATFSRRGAARPRRLGHKCVGPETKPRHAGGVRIRCGALSSTRVASPTASHFLREFALARSEKRTVRWY